MGCFSWMFADSKRENLHIGNPFYLLLPNGGYLKDSWYNGYGDVSGEDIYDLVADWNREYLSAHPDFVIKSLNAMVSEMAWWPEYSDLSLSREEVSNRACLEYREIGIDLACENNSALPFPIKVCKNKPTKEYSYYPASEDDPNQGL